MPKDQEVLHNLLEDLKRATEKPMREQAEQTQDEASQAPESRGDECRPVHENVKPVGRVYSEDDMIDYPRYYGGDY